MYFITQAALAREKREFAEKMREELEDQLQIKEAMLLEGLEKQKQGDCEILEVTTYREVLDIPVCCYSFTEIYDENNL